MRIGALAGLVALALIWGTNFLLVDLALRGLGAENVVFYRLVLATLVLSCWLLITRTRGTLDRRSWLRLGLLGVFGQALPWSLFAWGQQTVPSGIAGVYTGATPLLTVPLAFLLLRRRAAPFELAGTAVGFVGVVVVFSPWSVFGSGGSVLAQLACLGGALSYALSFAYAGRLLRDIDAPRLVLATAQAFTSTVLVGLISAPSAQVAPLATTPVLLGVLGLGIGSAAAYIINYWLIATIGPVKASLSFYLIPVVALLTGIAVNGERPAPMQLAGSVLVVGALAVLYMGERREAAAAASRSIPAPPT